ncbi:MAG: hypothetical protein COY58_05925 [Gammaproteobacteria bacterium CG_4_10_14_0_8_um_filter_38_16]|nr:MAG: hypothetical protein COY58_05925 [Gammaproteobacteria bacterium CG_4_10_14_0_8_um_filter_38_16]PJA04425.1 MAG: hypothetical protein COX72_00535 [Gammaproteobacteria bacterium CG_4_10_14_0_2_um_filter_38_22]PJB10153.1 MAG: hypothetical protein CO120_06045 [Gammaproteobacteria bacterium CG_4_9_14_3_um_filter_38_9]
MKKKIMGTTLALAAAFAFAAAPVATSMAASAHQVKCMGGNSCKGKTMCKTAHNKCNGKNACKGKGVVMMKSVKACKKAGGTVKK